MVIDSFKELKRSGRRLKKKAIETSETFKREIGIFESPRNKLLFPIVSKRFKPKKFAKFF